jgi:signal transduction histidine kinase/CheY-like chemotaxis protein
MESDTLTFLVFAVLLLGFLGLLQVWLWRQDRALAALGIWGGALLVAASGLALMASRGWLPDRISIDAALAILSLGYGLAWAGARRLERRRIHLTVVLGGAVLWLLACQIPELYLRLPIRFTVGTWIFTAYNLLLMCEFLRQRDGSPLPSRHALVLTFGAAAALQFSRAAIALVHGVGQGASGLPASAWLTFSAMAGIVLVAGTSVLLIAVAKEEAEQRAIATLALARDAADRANAAKSRFLARMSHELRTPLNGVLGMAQALTHDPMLRGGQRQRAILLEQAGRHLLAIVNDLLAIASVEANRFDLAPQPALVHDIIRGGVDLVAATAAARQVRLDQTIAPDVPRAVLADPVRVRQIIVNLLGNAIKFTPSGGRVTLSVTYGAGLRLSVTDTGPGVPSDMVPHLFEDFTQRPVSGGPIESTGLGLAISASLARTMSGTIEYWPGPRGIGSVFTVELPLPTVEPPPSLSERLDEMPDARQGLTVLVVDDVESNRRVAEAFLLQAGITVLLADDGASALALLDQGAVPELILMDVYMPGMDGLTAVRAIRSRPGAVRSVPIIGLTADISMEQAQACREAGMTGYLTKPLDLGELFAAIGEAVPNAIVPAPDRPRQQRSYAER